jgi:hypothetical protein
VLLLLLLPLGSGPDAHAARFGDDGEGREKLGDVLPCWSTTIYLVARLGSGENPVPRAPPPEGIAKMGVVGLPVGDIGGRSEMALKGEPRCSSEMALPYELRSPAGRKKSFSLRRLAGKRFGEKKN